MACSPVVMYNGNWYIIKYRHKHNWIRNEVVPDLVGGEIARQKEPYSIRTVNLREGIAKSYCSCVCVHVLCYILLWNVCIYIYIYISVCARACVLRAYNMRWPVLRITVVVLLTWRGLSHVRVQLYIMTGHVVCGEEFVTTATPVDASCAIVMMYVFVLYDRLRSRCDGSRRVVFIEFWIFFFHIVHNNTCIGVYYYFIGTCDLQYRAVWCILLWISLFGF